MSTIGIKELAEFAGVSVATASRAISNPNRVSKVTREKVQAAAKEIGYTPNRLGAGLRTSKTGNVIVIIPDAGDTFNFGAIKAIEKAASEHGFSVLLGDTQNLRERELAYGDLVRTRQADGIIFFSYRLPFDIEPGQEADFEMPPIVNSCEDVGRNDIPLVSINNELAGEEATQHLIDLGHENIAVITGDSNTPSTQDRLKGYLTALKKAGIRKRQEFIQEGQYCIEQGEESTKSLLQLKQRPSAIFCFSDEIAIGCLSTLKSAGFEVPGDMSVIGFDDIRFAKYFYPPLTTVAQPVELIGKTCMQVLAKLINKQEVPEMRIILPHQLIVRESTGKPR
ncbi:HTH-type transcriptional repressor CytR [Thalassocella blandensis]|nr:HTH-type transcriptional repressor CytR [Thalassocella blandensis]